MKHYWVDKAKARLKPGCMTILELPTGLDLNQVAQCYLP